MTSPAKHLAADAHFAEACGLAVRALTSAADEALSLKPRLDYLLGRAEEYLVVPEERRAWLREHLGLDGSLNAHLRALLEGKASGLADARAAFARCVRMIDDVAKRIDDGGTT